MPSFMGMLLCSWHFLSLLSLMLPGRKKLCRQYFQKLFYGAEKKHLHIQSWIALLEPSLTKWSYCHFSESKCKDYWDRLSLPLCVCVCGICKRVKGGEGEESREWERESERRRGGRKRERRINVYLIEILSVVTSPEKQQKDVMATIWKCGWS